MGAAPSIRPDQQVRSDTFVYQIDGAVVVAPQGALDQAGYGRGWEVR